MPSPSPSSYPDTDDSTPNRLSFRIVRAFKALDDGERRKWVLVVRLQDLPTTFPLDANARVPNVLKNKTCNEMRATLLTRPDLFQIFNGGMVCTAESLALRQVEGATYADIGFDSSRGQGIVNGGHSYAAAIHVAHGVTAYADDKDLSLVLADDVKKYRSEVQILVTDPQLLAERIARARQDACIQIEVVAPVPDTDLLEQIARARNLSQSVEDTALANLAGKFDEIKKVLHDAYGPEIVQGIVWKTNMEVPEGSRRIPVKLILHILALMNIYTYKPGQRVANEVYSRSGMVVRDFIESDKDRQAFYSRLVESLPCFLELYDKVYLSLPESDPQYPWASGKIGDDARRRGGTSPIFGHPCESKVFHAFVWPIFAAMRLLLFQREPGGDLWFHIDPVLLFEEKRQELIETVKSFHKNQAHGIAQQVGKDKELWIRLESIVDLELKLRRRLDALGDPFPPRNTKLHTLPGRDRADDDTANNDSYTHTRPLNCTFLGEPLDCETWKDVYTGVATMLADRHSDFVERATQLRGRVRAFFSTSRDGMNSPKLVNGTGVFMETGFSANDIVTRAWGLLEHFGYSRQDLYLDHEAI